MNHATIGHKLTFRPNARTYPWSRFFHGGPWRNHQVTNPGGPSSDHLPWRANVNAQLEVRS